MIGLLLVIAIWLLFGAQAAGIALLAFVALSVWAHSNG